MSTPNLKLARKASPAVLRAKLALSHPGPTAGTVQARLGSSTSPIEVYTLKSLPATLRGWIFDLFERNMKAFYEASADGYDAKEKRQELFDPESRFVVLGSPPVAYAVFRFDTEETADEREAEVVYCYEVQVEPTARGMGTGRALMDVLSELGREFKLEKVMLTVFKANTSAVDFYHKLGYAPDEICPSRCDEPDADYWIMSKPC